MVMLPTAVVSPRERRVTYMWVIDKDDDYLRMCPICGGLFPRQEMTFTHDCHGIPFRLACYDCYNEVMGERGYDGEYYTELDENIWGD